MPYEDMRPFKSQVDSVVKGIHKWEFVYQPPAAGKKQSKETNVPACEPMCHRVTQINSHAIRREQRQPTL